MKKSFFRILVIFPGAILYALFYSCSNEITREAQSDKDDFYGTINNFPDSLLLNENEAKIYTMPTPLQISSAIKIYGFKYNEKLLLPVVQNVSYSSNFSKALNLGMRTIDLGYATVYSNHARAFDYLKNVKQLTEELGISSYEQSQIMERFEKNIQNQDSLFKIVLESYRHGHDYFQNNGREGLGLLILTGCFVEGLHLTMGIKNEKISSDEKYLNLIAQQKLYLQNLVELLAYYSNANEVQALITKLSLLNGDFEKIHLNFNDPSTKPFAIKGNIPQEIYESIETKITALRSEIVG